MSDIDFVFAFKSHVRANACRARLFGVAFLGNECVLTEEQFVLVTE